VRDDRPWGGPDPPGAAYVYAPDRTGERPVQHLAGFTGVLQVDGYGGYRKRRREHTDGGAVVDGRRVDQAAAAIVFGS
jgi:hypothetical protein